MTGAVVFLDASYCKQNPEAILEATDESGASKRIAPVGVGNVCIGVGICLAVTIHFRPNWIFLLLKQVQASLPTSPGALLQNAMSFSAPWDYEAAPMPGACVYVCVYVCV